MAFLASLNELLIRKIITGDSEALKVSVSLELLCQFREKEKQATSMAAYGGWWRSNACCEINQMFFRGEFEFYDYDWSDVAFRRMYQLVFRFRLMPKDTCTARRYHL